MAEEPVARVMARYERWLSEQRLSAATRRSYRRWVADRFARLRVRDRSRDELCESAWNRLRALTSLALAYTTRWSGTPRALHPSQRSDPSRQI